MEFKNSEDFRAAAEELLKLVERQEHGEISESELLIAWKRFMRAGEKYLKKLGQESKLN